MSDTAKRKTTTAWLIRAVAAGLGVCVGLTYALFGLMQAPEERRWAGADVVSVEEPRFTSLLAYGSDPGQPPPAGRYVADWRSPTVAVYSSPSARPAPPPFALKDLSDNGQAHAIDLVAQRAGTTWPELTKALSGTAGDIERKDPYRADRVLVATVAKGVDARPGDRLLWTRVYVQPINFEFAGYTVAATDNKTLKLASVENTNSNKLGLEASLPGLSKSTVNQSVETFRKMTSDVSEQYENLGIDIQPDFLRIIRESAAGGDVAGNVAVALSIVTDHHMIWRVSSGGTEASRPEEKLVLLVSQGRLTDGAGYLENPEAKLTVHPQNALPHCPLKAKVWMLYETRKITDGAANYIEGLQRVALIKNVDDMREVDIVRADDIAPAVWTIQVDGGSAAGKALQARTKDNNGHDLVFTDYVIASELTHWLKAHPPGTPLGELLFPDYTGQTLRPSKNVTNECSPQNVQTTEVIPFR